MIELNMDGLVGPTHHYAGLSSGNIASMDNALSEANPKAAALQGIAKMRLLHERGIPQAFLPPHARPYLPLLKQLGFEGSTESMIHQAYRFAPQLLSAAFSASNMWTANAATVTSYQDSQDKRTHFTAANLNANIHRHIEATFSAQLLQMAFSNLDHFAHHPVLPATAVMGDEGAANHTRLGFHNQPGVNLFVFGQQGLQNNLYSRPKRYWARQTLEASRQIAYTHGLREDNSVFACQNPDVIDQGVFHNDVISVGNENILLIHELAYVNQKQILAELKSKIHFDLNIFEVKNSELPIADAVSTYLFNSQIISLPNHQGMLLVAPSECEQNDHVRELVQSWIGDSDCPLTQVVFLDLKQSMRNGGGPACLRLRVPLSEAGLKAINPGFLINEHKLMELESWVKKHYRDKLHLSDLCDPQLINEVNTALSELSAIMNIPHLYPFQQ
jgi:succinylarginine dihydrolase